MSGRSILHLRLSGDSEGRGAEDPARALTALCRRTTPVWELTSSGAYLDLTGTERLYGPGIDGASRISTLARDSAGILGGGAAPTRLAARLASLTAARAGGGTLAVLAAQVSVFLEPFPVKFLPGRASVVNRLRQLGVRTLGDLQMVPPLLLRSVFGAWASRLADEAWGRRTGSQLGGGGDPAASRSSLTLVVGVRLVRPALSASVTSALRRGLAVRALTICPGGPAGGRKWRLTVFRPEGRPDEATVRGLERHGWKSWHGLVDLLWSRLPARRQGLMGLELWAETPRAAAPSQGHLFDEDEADGRLAEVMRRCRSTTGIALGLASEELLTSGSVVWYGPGA